MYLVVKEWTATKVCTEFVSRVVPKINKLYKNVGAGFILVQGVTGGIP